MRASLLPFHARRSLRLAALGMATMAAGTRPVVLKKEALQFPVSPPSPFLFAANHVDYYPAGSAKNMEAPRRGNGADFDPAAPYRMYHGERTPGFPAHPHRGFETLTCTLDGFADHADSGGNSGRYGHGDLQWLTAGAGVQHSEMFPLVHTDKPNTLRLFQLWLNLPRRNKMAAPGFIMSWAENRVRVEGQFGASAALYAGRLGGVDSRVTPGPASWAADPANDVAVAVITLPPGGSKFTIPPAEQGAAINRVAYITDGGKGLSIDGVRFTGSAAVTLDASQAAEVINGGMEDAQVLMLQGRPIDEPVAQRGPFVMNTQQEIAEAYRDFQRTQFGGWPWAELETEDRAPVFARGAGRFASYKQADGSVRVEYPPAAAGSPAKTEL